jgi:hypothetical protein
MAAHNSGRFVEKQSRAWYCKNYRLEMVVVCDAPIDGTSETVQRLAAMDSRIRCKILPRNVGVGAAYSIALSKARGEICGILDADDCLPPEAMTTIVKFYDALPDVGFIWTMHNWYNETMSKVRRGISNPPSAGTIYASEDGFKHVYSHWRTFRTKFRDQAVLFDPDLKCTVDKNLGYVLEQLTPGAFLPIRLYNIDITGEIFLTKHPRKKFGGSSGKSIKMQSDLSQSSSTQMCDVLALNYHKTVREQFDRVEAACRDSHSIRLRRIGYPAPESDRDLLSYGVIDRFLSSQPSFDVVLLGDIFWTTGQNICRWARKNSKRQFSCSTGCGFITRTKKTLRKRRTRYVYSVTMSPPK